LPEARWHFQLEAQAHCIAARLGGHISARQCASTTLLQPMNPLRLPKAGNPTQRNHISRHGQECKKVFESQWQPPLRPPSATQLALRPSARRRDRGHRDFTRISSAWQTVRKQVRQTGLRRCDIKGFRVLQHRAWGSCIVPAIND